MTNVIVFAESYYIRCVALERAEDQIESILLEQEAKNLTLLDRERMQKEVFQHFYKLEKQKFYQGLSCFKK